MSRPIIVAGTITVASFVYGVMTVVQVHADASGSGKFVTAPEWCFVDQQASAMICRYASQAACVEANKNKRGVCVIGVIMREEES
jgi:hypothetical protein